VPCEVQFTYVPVAWVAHVWGDSCPVCCSPRTTSYAWKQSETAWNTYIIAEESHHAGKHFVNLHSKRFSNTRQSQ